MLAYAATAVPATMDGAGVLYDDKDPLHVAALMDAIVSNADAAGRDRRRAARGASTGCRRRTSPARCSASSTRSSARRARRRRRSPSTSGISSTPPQELEELRLYRPAVYQGAAGAEDAGSAMIVNQWVPAAHRGRRHRRQRPARARPAARAWATTSELYALTIDDDLRDDVRPFARSGGAQRRPDDLSFRAAVADDRGVRVAAARAASCSITTSRRRRFSRPTIRRCSGWRRSAAQELATLVGRVDLALGDSEYNRRELEALGLRADRRLSDRRRHRAHHAAASTGRRSTRSSTTGS